MNEKETIGLKIYSDIIHLSMMSYHRMSQNENEILSIGYGKLLSRIFSVCVDVRIVMENISSDYISEVEMK